MTLPMQTTPRPERITSDGHVLLSHNHVCMLQALYARPRHRVASRAEWIEATREYQRDYVYGSSEWRLRRAMSTINRQWISEVKKGRSIEVTLTRRGKEIIERQVPSRIIGIGLFTGMPLTKKRPTAKHEPLQKAAVEMSAKPVQAKPIPVKPASVKPASVKPAPANPAPVEVVQENPIRRIVDFATTFGLPLLEANPHGRTRGTVIAVTTGLDRFFRIACREELDMHAPRRWHLKWVRAAIDVGLVPAGYLNAFEDFEEEDILCHLRELLQQEDGDLGRYVEVYRGKPFLSRALRDQWLDEIIDLAETDMTPQCRTDFVRCRSDQYRIAMQSIRDESLEWYDPDTQRMIGRAVKRSSHQWEMEELEVTTPAALSCLQQYWDEKGIGLNIETRYIPKEL